MICSGCGKSSGYSGPTSDPKKELKINSPFKGFLKQATFGSIGVNCPKIKIWVICRYICAFVRYLFFMCVFN